MQLNYNTAKNICIARVCALVLYGLVAGIIGSYINNPEDKEKILSKPEYKQIITTINEQKLDIDKIKRANRTDYPFFVYSASALGMLFILFTPYWLIKTVLLKILSLREKSGTNGTSIDPIE